MLFKKIKFEELTEKDKEKFFEFWEEEAIKEIADKIVNSLELKEAVYNQNIAIEQALYNTSRVSQDVVSKDEFVERFFYELNNIATVSLNRSSSSSSSSGGSQLNSNCVIEENVKILQECFKPGRFVVTLGSNGTSFGLSGHASMMYEEPNIEEKINGYQMVMITSTPNSKNSLQWPGKIDGVQYEPLAYWAGTQNDCAKNVYIFDVRKKRWIWNWFRSHYEYTDATEEEHNRALEIATQERGKPYSLNLFPPVNKEFYCSELIWYAWKSVSSDYNLYRGILWISPIDLVLSFNSREIKSFYNS